MLSESEFVYGKGFVGKLLDKLRKFAEQHLELKASLTKEFQQGSTCQEKHCDLCSKRENQDKKLDTGRLKGNC